MDDVKAVVWYRKAEAAGHPLSHINLADFFDHGRASDVNHARAAEYVLKAFELGDKWDDPFNRDQVFGRKWTPEFWREMQSKLKERGHYDGPVDGQLTQATRDAFEKIVEK